MVATATSVKWPASAPPRRTATVATERCKAAAERALRGALASRTAPAGELITADMQLINLADLWITGLEGEGRIEQSTINEYRRVLDNLALPSGGRLKLSEITTDQLDRLLLRLQDSSVNRQRVNADRPGPKASGDMADIIDLMLATGCRIGEVLALRWSNLDLEADRPANPDGLGDVL